MLAGWLAGWLADIGSFIRWYADHIHFTVFQLQARVDARTRSYKIIYARLQKRKFTPNRNTKHNTRERLYS